jgi:hypothetical protein
MAKQSVFLGTAANDGTGTALRTAFDYINDNADELYALLGDGTNLSISGDATMSAGAVTIANDVIDHDKLATRYSEKVEKSDTSGAVSIDWSAGTTFEFTATLTGNIELDFTGFKQGQVIDIYGLTGAFTVTLDSDAATSETFNLVGSGSYDGALTNFLQVVCLDDSADAVFNYSIATYASDTIIGD